MAIQYNEPEFLYSYALAKEDLTKPNLLNISDKPEFLYALQSISKLLL